MSDELSAPNQTILKDELIAPQQTILKADNSSITERDIKGNATAGTLTKKIGTGENAKDSIVWMTITWSLLIGGFITLALYLRPMYCSTNYFGSLIDDVKTTWSIFLPLIMLALGYTFGKGT